MFQPFLVEQFLSEHEQRVSWNFSESGVHPLTLGELLALGGREPASLDPVLLNYPEVNGLRALRESIAALYPVAEADQVLVTVGASEANLLIAQTLLHPGDEVVVFTPNYRQLSGNAVNLGYRLSEVPLDPEKGWALDLDALEAAVTPATRLIGVVNPHNPTGHILSEAERRAVVHAADRVGAWIVADEVYAGAERDANQATPSLWGEYHRVLAVNSLSKAYGLPGLRLGWIVAPREMTEALWRRHEYANIATTMLANELARIALDPAVRPKILERTRELIRQGFDRLREGLARAPGVFSVTAPQASAMSFIRFDLPLRSRDLALRLIREESLLLVPGECFGRDDHFRFSSALPTDYLAEGLNRLNRQVKRILAGD